MFQIDPLSRIPVYEQIVTQAENMVTKDVLKPGDPLPSVRSLSIQMSINPNTIQKAYTELERRGLLVSVSGKGSFVRKNLDDFFFRLRARQRKQFEDLVRELQKGGVPLSVLEESLHAIYEKEETLAI
ncbi:MAG: GntR family transcriptional regulator [Lachnospiraceae bacterium]|jgi:GntR family transcriptional regulator|nr:GntR family transcriptional regulator [Lachnospiraceae bacterium]MBR6978024.1 GntR family transcriptional regulator [Lachnospiraceae bacterium]